MIKIRRKFLVWFLWLVPVALVWRYLTPAKVKNEGIKVPLDRIPVNGAYLIRDKQVGVINVKGDIRVMSIACTHLGCTLNVNGENLICPCHGSIFDLQGKVLKGPATKDLKTINFEIKDSSVFIYV